MIMGDSEFGSSPSVGFSHGNDTGFSKGIKAGRAALLAELLAELKENRSAKPYVDGESSLAHENKSGWNHCNQYIKELLESKKV